MIDWCLTPTLVSVYMISNRKFQTLTFNEQCRYRSTDYWVDDTLIVKQQRYYLYVFNQLVGLVSTVSISVQGLLNCNSSSI